MPRLKRVYRVRLTKWVVQVNRLGDWETISEPVSKHIAEQLMARWNETEGCFEDY